MTKCIGIRLGVSLAKLSTSIGATIVPLDCALVTNLRQSNVVADQGFDYMSNVMRDE